MNRGKLLSFDFVLLVTRLPSIRADSTQAAE